MPKLLAIALIVLSCLACGHAKTTATDAGPCGDALVASGQPVEAPTIDPEPQPSARPTRPKPAPPDPRVMACVRNATDKSTLMDCLDALKGQIEAPAPDAGPHKFGATRPPPINPAWSVPHWYVNSSTGSKDNTCVSSGSPCNSWAEIVARWETNAPLITTAVIVEFLADNPSTDPITFAPTLFGNGSGTFEFLGQRTSVATGTIASLSAKNRASSGAYPLGLLQANLGGSQAQGLLVVNSTRSNSVAWIDGLVAGPLSVLTQPLGENIASWNVAPSEFDTWSNGDSFILYQLTSVYMTSFNPVVATGDMSGDQRYAYLANMRLKDAVGAGRGLLSFGNLVLATECRIDPIAAVSDQPHITGPQLVNVWSGGGIQLIPGILVGGGYGVGTRMAGILDGDVILHGAVSIGVAPGFAISSPNISSSSLGLVYLDNGTGGTARTKVYGDTIVEKTEYASGALYGRYALRLATGSLVKYLAPAVNTFLGVGAAGGANLLMYDVAFASAYDTSVTPAQWYPARSLSPTQLDTSIASGGFGGNAYGDSGQVIAVDGQQATAAPASYCNAVANCGTGVGTLCTSGQCLVSNGSAYVCQTCGSSSLPDPVTVPHGGTGDTTLTAHAVLVGEGTSAVVTVGPQSAVGIPLVSEGLTTDPAFGTATVQGGGTGLAASLAHGILIGQGGSAPNLLSIVPGAIGTFLAGQGSSADPVFATLASVYPVAEATGSGTITTTLTTALSISLVVNTGQKAYIWATAWFESTDTNVHIILMALNATTESKVGIGATGSVFDEVNGTYMASDSTVGTNTYNLKFALDTALGAGVVNYPVATLRGQVR